MITRWRSIRPIVWQLGAYAAFWAQVRLFTDLRGHFSPYVQPLLLAGAALLLSVFAVLHFLHRPAPTTGPTPAQAATRLAWGGLALLLGGAWVLYYQAPNIVNSPVDVRYSDVIPIVQNYVGRFRSGEVVYRYITNLPYPLFPNHLPLQWLPYVLPDELGLDYRWWSLGLLLLLGFGAWQVALAQQRIGWLEFALKALLPAFVLVHILKHDPFIYAQVLEPTIIAYYCVLAASVLSRSALAQAAALVLCLLSRYSVVLWVPFYLWVLWREVGRRHSLVVAGLTLLGIVGLYVVPFLSKDWTIFTHALNEYRIATVGEWSRSDGPGGNPDHIFNGLGMASWFYSYAPGDLLHKITWLQRTHLLAGGTTVLAGAALYWRLRHRLDYRLLALVVLQLYLTVFYLFLQIPYAYLFSLTLFTSAFLVLAVGGSWWRPAPVAQAPA
ncbi:hypothetical protein AUC43_04950 [Hymenobacter sedentarius]|uniref:Glycosyltransferase RgtA/B/C/D-like domain-containing protein n=1 Tax=Hymenobacter sedentarius TaxID=1411621 RepID=A0A0U4C2W3_9BACT|nr:hypothetical protein [Hymenobacter sedentarius]ALW84488.1 hypothetical protein AUC43_04950 [Hymenobacter sedentarius]